jgi:hypothetical protein
MDLIQADMGMAAGMAASLDSEDTAAVDQVRDTILMAQESVED